MVLFLESAVSLAELKKIYCSFSKIKPSCSSILPMHNYPLIEPCTACPVGSRKSYLIVSKRSGLDFWNYENTTIFNSLLVFRMTEIQGYFEVQKPEYINESVKEVTAHATAYAYK